MTLSTHIKELNAMEETISLEHQQVLLHLLKVVILLIGRQVLPNLILNQSSLLKIKMEQFHIPVLNLMHSFGLIFKEMKIYVLI